MVILVLAVVCVLLLAWLVVMCLACYGLFLRLREVEELLRRKCAEFDELEDIAGNQARRIRHLRERIDGYRAELDALSITPPAATAALTPDDPSLLPAEIEQWLRTRES